MCLKTLILDLAHQEGMSLCLVCSLSSFEQTSRHVQDTIQFHRVVGYRTLAPAFSSFKQPSKCVRGRIQFHHPVDRPTLAPFFS